MTDAALEAAIQRAEREGPEAGAYILAPSGIVVLHHRDFVAVCPRVGPKRIIPRGNPS